jgi:hypothetical protein
MKDINMAIHTIKLTTEHKDEVTPEPEQLTDIDRKEATELRRKVHNAKTHKLKKAIIKEFLNKRIKQFSL